MITRRLINCDFFTKGNLSTKCSNKAKLLYFTFLVNADDMGFVGNGKEISETLDRCEENFENTLFQFTYVDAIQELIDQRLVYEFVDKTHNSIYLIKHWFLHNKKQEFLTTNYLSLLDKVEVVKGEYQLKNHKEEEQLKEIKIKEKQNKTISNNSLSINDFDSNKGLDSKSTNNKSWEEIIEDLENCK